MKVRSAPAAVLLSFAVILISGCVSDQAQEEQYVVTNMMIDMKISSPAFTDNGSIPAKFTCQGADVSPELRISGVPGNAKSLTLIVDDPDAPAGTWDHWVVFNIHPNTSVITEGHAPEDAVLGRNGWGKGKYGGPCPPSGTGAHRYMFKLYALDSSLPLDSSAGKKDVQVAMRDHVLAQATLVGRYKKS